MVISNQGLEQQVEAFAKWKKNLSRELKSFRLWLKRNQLSNPDYDMRVQHIIDTLSRDYLSIAFAGEFSRGKTELINALFFADFGQRILPSQAGRTTMCPTELFFDQDTKQSYLRLLPIETRLQDTCIEDYKDMLGHWVEIPLTVESPSEMAAAMQQITLTKSVKKEDAIALGFVEAQLEECMDQAGLYEIPAWRHAMVSFPHPLLKKGLCILDTPGLNALGSEPELTLSMLPNSQAVVFMLSADAGVTASDMQLWRENIKPLLDRPNLGVYAVLNKIDVLWDDIHTDKEIEKSMKKVVKQTAKQLGIKEKQIIPVSAQKGLLAKIRDQKSLLTRSRLQHVEAILSEEILENKERKLWEQVVHNVANMVSDSCTLLDARRNQLVNQKNELDSLRTDNREHLKSLLNRKRDAQTQLRKKHISIKPSLRLVEKQSEILLRMVSQEKVNQQIEMARESLINSRTTVGIIKSMRNFFKTSMLLIDDFAREAELSNKMVNSIYNKFRREHDIDLPDPRPIPSFRYQKLLSEILDDADQFNKNLLTTFSEHRIVVKRFFNTNVANVAQFYAWMRKELNQWRSSVITPLSHQLKMEKDMLDEHVNDLETINQNASTIQGRIRALNTLITELEMELENAQRFKSIIHEPAPVEKTSTNVIQLHTRSQ
jgi:hypothetical protein